MIFLFACPLPCHLEIKVDAKDYDDAISKIIEAGAIRCRNTNSRCSCENANHNMSPLPQERLKDIVRLCTIEERSAAINA